jgi:hypothetical protein
MIIKVIIAVIIVIIVHFFEGLTTSYNNIFYVYIRRGSRTCGIPVPSVFFNRNRNSFRILKRNWNRNSNRIPVHCKDTKRTSTSSRILEGVHLDTSQRIYELQLINTPKCKDTNPSSTAVKKTGRTWGSTSRILRLQGHSNIIRDVSHPVVSAYERSTKMPFMVVFWL